MVVAVTNMHYGESPYLWPSTAAKEALLDWSEVPLAGATAHALHRAGFVALRRRRAPGALCSFRAD